MLAEERRDLHKDRRDRKEEETGQFPRIPALGFLSRIGPGGRYRLIKPG
jgi:hypothetical protein